MNPRPVAIDILEARLCLSGNPACADHLATANHGHQVVGDFVIGFTEIAWPVNGRVIHEAIAGKGAYIHRGPGSGFQMPNGIAPGASVCIPQAQSPGVHAED